MPCGPGGSASRGFPPSPAPSRRRRPFRRLSGLRRARLRVLPSPQRSRRWPHPRFPARSGFIPRERSDPHRDAPTSFAAAATGARTALDPGPQPGTPTADLAPQALGGVPGRPGAGPGARRQGPEGRPGPPGAAGRGGGLQPAAGSRLAVLRVHEDDLLLRLGSPAGDPKPQWTPAAGPARSRTSGRIRPSASSGGRRPRKAQTVGTRSRGAAGRCRRRPTQPP